MSPDPLGRLVKQGSEFVTLEAIIYPEDYSFLETL